ncbi:FkbM family methyltransferase [Methylobacterium brachiatum]|uniref:FkbM family methyltransferase n=1 Tax=Methylobacterium brachiatum TaxID=269660 RepID=UPI000EFB266A|nr:FkbM family methyltransferase [Methylobacterium brachiatum]AYO82076.1 FkbM family methyltransferase [Methylobacterium brachiatum]
MSFALDIVRNIVAHRSVEIPDPIIDRWVFGDRVPSPLPAAHALEAVARLIENQAEYDHVGSLLDARSRKLLGDVITYRALGPVRYALPMSTPDYMDLYAKAATFRVGPSEQVFPPFLFETFAVEDQGHRLELGAWLGNIVATFLVRQYYLDGPRRIQPETGDVVIDAGGCFGDTALAFAASVGETGRVFSFDPLPAHQAVMRANFDRNPQLAERIALVPHALSHAAGETVRFAAKGAGSFMHAQGEIEARTDTIDQLVERQGLDRVDFIKMDIEGAERSALIGARTTIARHKPKLAISGYHSEDDLIIIPMLIKRLNPDYEIHIGHHTNFEWETVVYAA